MRKIDADRLKNNILNYEGMFKHSNGIAALNWVVSLIDSQPEAKDSPTYGHWIHKMEDVPIYGTDEVERTLVIRCSECGYCYTGFGDVDECPVCGAVMDGECNV